MYIIKTETDWIIELKTYIYSVLILIIASSIIAIGMESTPKTPLNQLQKELLPEKETRSIKRKFRVSAYCKNECCCGEYSDGITASGHKINEGDKLIAAPRDISFGTMIRIPGYGVASVEDRGGAITGNRLDLYFDTHQEALNWGVQYLECEVME